MQHLSPVYFGYLPLARLFASHADADFALRTHSASQLRRRAGAIQDHQCLLKCNSQLFSSLRDICKGDISTWRLFHRGQFEHYAANCHALRVVSYSRPTLQEDGLRMTTSRQSSQRARFPSFSKTSHLSSHGGSQSHCTTTYRPRSLTQEGPLRRRNYPYRLPITSSTQTPSSLATDYYPTAQIRYRVLDRRLCGACGPAARCERDRR